MRSHIWPTSGQMDQVISFIFRAEMAIEQVYVHRVIQYSISPEYNKDRTKSCVLTGELKVSDIYSFK